MASVLRLARFGDNRGGMGLVAVLGATVSITGVEVADSTMAGLQLVRLGSLAGQSLAILNNPIGVNIQDVPDGYEFFDAVTGLFMEGNQVNYDYSELPVPDPVEEIETGDE